MTTTKTTPQKPRTPRTKGASKGGGRKAPKVAGSTKTARLSGLDAAAQVLSQSREPMNCVDLTKRVLDKGLWKTSGKTPAATLSSAIIREIKSKGAESRFRKVGRGLFSAKRA